MSPKTMLVTAPLALGALVLAWAAGASRGNEESKPVRPERKTTVARTVLPAEASLPVRESPASASYVAPPTASSGGEYAVIEDRIRKLEEKLLTLETKRNELAASNQDLERQIGEKNAEASARMQAEWRVQSWAQSLGLSDTQKQALLDLWTGWIKADGGRVAGRETWQTREGDLRSRLSVEQAGKLHDTAARQSELQWSALGRSIGSMIGGSKEDATRFQQTLGSWRAPGPMLLPEAHGADWAGFLREGAGRLQSVLTPEQTARLGQYIK